jgi:hypothetical protein
MLIRPVLDDPVAFACTEYVTVPGPVFVSPAVTVSHGESGVALHEQDGDEVVTVNVPVAAAFVGNVTTFGVEVKTQLTSCVIEKVAETPPPVTVTMPVRGAPVLGKTMTEIEPLPVPPPLTERKVLVVDATQAQLFPVVTVNVVVPPAPLTAAEAGVNTKLQGDAVLKVSTVE